MNIEHLQNCINIFIASQVSTLIKKGEDYSKEDKLSNFKEVASIIGIAPEQVALVLICVKVSRLGTLFSNQKANPQNESIEDSILDLANYTVLLNAIWQEKTKQP